MTNAKTLSSIFESTMQNEVASSVVTHNEPELRKRQKVKLVVGLTKDNTMKLTRKKEEYGTTYEFTCEQGHQHATVKWEQDGYVDPYSHEYMRRFREWHVLRWIEPDGWEVVDYETHLRDVRQWKCEGRQR